MPRATRKQSRATRTQTHRRRGGQEPHKNIRRSWRLSVASNHNKRYENVGIVHVTGTAGLGAMRQEATDFLNWFGSQGVDTSAFDDSRNDALDKLSKQLNDKQ